MSVAVDLVWGVHLELPVGHNLMVARHLQKTPTRIQREKCMKHRSLSLPIVIFVSYLPSHPTLHRFPARLLGLWMETQSMSCATANRNASACTASTVPRKNNRTGTKPSGSPPT